MALRFQFRLRALLVFVSLAGLGSAILARLYDRDRRERTAVRTAYALGGSVGSEDRHRFSWLPRSRKYTTLAFYNCDVARTDISFLEALRDLRVIYMSGSSVTDEQMRVIRRVATLESLNVGGSQVTDAGLALLDKCVRLKTLRFAKTAVNGSAFEKLRALPELENVCADNCQLGDDALALLAECPRLRVVEVSSASITDRGARALGGAQRLEEVILCGDITPHGAESLFALPCLKHLIVHGRGDFWGHWTREPDDSWRLLRGGVPTKNPTTTE